MGDNVIISTQNLKLKDWLLQVVTRLMPALLANDCSIPEREPGIFEKCGLIHKLTEKESNPTSNGDGSRNNAPPASSKAREDELRGARTKHFSCDKGGVPLSMSTDTRPPVKIGNAATRNRGIGTTFNGVATEM
jgi:hypothetical protein